MVNHTNMERKENVRELFFNYPTKHWHFEELVKKSGLSRAQTNIWLKKMLKEKIIKKIKEKGKTPFYISIYNTKYKVQKKMYALSKFEKIGFLNHLSSLKDAKTIIIFGSFSRADWHNESDIDLFIYGNSKGFEKGYYEKKLNREIQVFEYKNKKDLKKLDKSIIPHILSGINIKNNIEPFEVKINA